MERSHQFSYPGSPAPAALTRQRRDAAAATILDTESATSCTPLADCYLLHSRCSRGSDRDLGKGTAAKVHQPREGLLTRQRRDAAAATILDTESATSCTPLADCYLSHFQMQKIRS